MNIFAGIDYIKLNFPYKDNYYLINAIDNDHITECFKQGLWYEQALLEKILEFYGKGGTYYDFGAYIGTHSLFFSKICQADLVVAVEPNPISFHALYNNKIDNQCLNMDIYNIAIGDRYGRCILKQIGNNYGCFDIEKTKKYTNTVPLFDIDFIIYELPKLIKIDCESSTLNILENYLGYMDEHKPVIVIESHSPDDLKIILQLLEGYRVRYEYKSQPNSTYILEHS